MSNDYSACFSPDFATARGRFREATASPESIILEGRGPNGESLSIDAARLGSGRRRLVVVSSGLHGVEGYYGSAVQLAIASRIDEIPPDTSVLLLHALNPYGFAWGRRWDANNVDLNRNFLLTDEKYEGSPPLYERLDSFLNPASWRDWWFPFNLSAGYFILRYSHRQLQQTIPVGQYDFPYGLFFGGSEPAATQRLLQQHLPAWIGDAEQVVHLDLHTGLGRFSECAVLVDAEQDSPRVSRLREWFGGAVKANPSQSTGDDSETAYRSRGTLEKWCLSTFSDRDYDFATVEVGTYSMRHVLGSLRKENYYHRRETAGSPSLAQARRQVREAFAPASERWRQAAVEKTLRVVDDVLTSSMDSPQTNNSPSQ